MRSPRDPALLATLALVASCGLNPREKPKIELEQAEGLGKASSAVGDLGGSWLPVRTIDSAHPYASYYDNTTVVTGSADAVALKVVFTRFELETGYDFLEISDAGGGQLTRHTGIQTGHELVVDGNKVRLRLLTDYSVTKWGARLQIFERVACVCPQIYQPVCGDDGTTYGNACEAGCAGIGHAPGACASADWFRVDRLIESEHPYANDTRAVWEIGEAGATRIRAHFRSINVENGYDVVNILDAAGRLVHSYTGRHNDIVTPVVDGGRMTIELVTDYSIVRNGFVLDYYEVQGGCASDADCGAGSSCIQVQCIRAPCFALCEATGYVPVDLQELIRDPRAYADQRIEVVGEPAAGTARCTKMACSIDNPCCNACASSLQLDGDITLTHDDGREMGCTGNECDYQTSCEPFPGADAGRYALRGVFEVGAYDALRLRVQSFEAVDCAAGGCSGELCANGPRFSACVALPQHACFAGESCEPQADGHCGWTQSPELLACLDGFTNGGGAGPWVFESEDTPLYIPDNQAAGVTSTITVDAGSATTVRVSLSIRHTYRGDLRVTLIAPSGQSALLHDRAGSGADDLVLNAVEVPALAGGALNGTWQLAVVDTEAYDTGVLERWSLQVE